MAEEKVVDRNGVKQLYKKTRMGLLTEAELEDRLEYINYISNEEAPKQSYTASHDGPTIPKTSNITLNSNGISYGKAKEVVVVVSGTIKGNYYNPYVLTVNLYLPNGGVWFLDNEIYAGGAKITSFSITGNDSSLEKTYSETRTFHIARVK